MSAAQMKKIGVTALIAVIAVTVANRVEATRRIMNNG